MQDVASSTRVSLPPANEICMICGKQKAAEAALEK
jgi:hypothetical protein